MAPLRSRIPCPNCGVRAIEEFVYGEIPDAPSDLSDPDARDVDRGFMHGNTEGPVTERWFHTFGCRRWITIRRDTRTNTVL
jgi:heterotetrameric sarcosine oxidase delta subunit